MTSYITILLCAYLALSHWDLIIGVSPQKIYSSIRARPNMAWCKQLESQLPAGQSVPSKVNRRQFDAKVQHCTKLWAQIGYSPEEIQLLVRFSKQYYGPLLTSEAETVPDAKDQRKKSKWPLIRRVFRNPFKRRTQNRAMGYFTSSSSAEAWCRELESQLLGDNEKPATPTDVDRVEFNGKVQECASFWAKRGYSSSEIQVLVLMSKHYNGPLLNSEEPSSQEPRSGGFKKWLRNPFKKRSKDRATLIES